MPLEKKCLNCQLIYHTYNKNRKYCGHRCADFSNRNSQRLTPRKPRAKETKKRKEREKKKYFCSICLCAEVNRKSKYCKKCNSSKNKIIDKCIACGETTISDRSRLRKFCSKKCKLSFHKGKTNPNYIDGRTPENKRIRSSPEYKAWRISVFNRDGFTCLHCGKIGGELHADHIKPFSQYPELRLDLSNGRTLCRPCHEKTPTWLSGAKKFSRNSVIIDPDQLIELLK